MNKSILWLLTAGLVLGLVAIASAEEPVVAAPADSASVDSVEKAAQPAADQKIIATYFHGNRRCPTCMKLEAYSQEAITGGFAAEIESGLIEWRVVNFDEEENEHFTKDYGLFSQSVILSRVRDGKETDWKNLDKIWTLVGDKPEFLAYVQKETKVFMAGPEEAQPK